MPTAPNNKLTSGYKHPLMMLVAFLSFVLFLNAAKSYGLTAKGVPGAGPLGTSVGEVWIDDQLIMKLYGIGNARVHKEAQNIAALLNEAFSNNLNPSQIYALKLEKGYAIIADKKTLFVVTKEQAHLHRSNPKELAILWVGKIRNALKTTSIPITHSIKMLTAFNLIIPQGAERTISLRGVDKADKIEVTNPNVIKLIPIGNTLRVRGENIGQTKIIVQWGNKTKVFTITVKEWAGLIPPYVETLVTGWPARSEFVRSAAIEALSKSIIRKPNSRLFIDTKGLSFPASLKEGTSISNYVNVRVTGTSNISVQGKVQLKVINFLLPKEETAYLLVSNKPEFIRQPGIVFSETLLDNRPTRFLFHHANALPDEKLLMHIKLVNRTETPSKIHIIEGIGGPTSDEINAGHVATYEFLTSFWRWEGKVINLPAHAEHILFAEWIAKREVTAGIYQFRVLEGGLPTVLIEARNRSLLQTPLTTISPPTVNEAFRHAKGVFENPDIIVEKEHIIGNGFTFIPIGKKPYLKELFTGEPNYGNYGVIYQIKLSIKNPGDEKRTAKIYFVPVAGVARGIFKLGDTLIQTPMLPPFKQYLLGQYELTPGEEKTASILTTPQGGSFYPINIVIEN